MTDISKIENGRKKNPFSNLKRLAKFLDIEFERLKMLYVVDLIVGKVHKYDCSDKVFAVTEQQSTYLKSKSVN